MFYYTVVRQQIGHHSFNQMWRVAAREKDFIVSAVLDQVMSEFVVQFCCDTLVKLFAENFDRSLISIEGDPTYLHADIT